MRERSASVRLRNRTSTDNRRGADLSASLPARFDPPSPCDIAIELPLHKSFTVPAARVALHEEIFIPLHPIARVMHPENKMPSITSWFPTNMISRQCVQAEVNLMRKQLLRGEGLLVSQNQYEDVHAAYEVACRAIGFAEKAPDLFVYAGGIGASTIGFAGGTSIVKVSNQMVDTFTSAELTFVLAHELGHLAFSHCVSGVDADGMLGLASILLCTVLAPSQITSEKVQKPDTYLGGAKSFLYNFFQIDLVALVIARRFSRINEYSADRAGLLAVRDPTVAYSALAKLCGGRAVPLSQEALRKQFELSDEAESSSIADRLQSLFLSSLSLLNDTHPTIKQRIEHLAEFAETEEFAKMLEETEPHALGEPLPDPEADSTRGIVDLVAPPRFERALPVASDFTYNFFVVAGVVGFVARVISTVAKPQS